MCQCKLNILKQKKINKKRPVLFSIVVHGTFKRKNKEEKVVLSYISNAYLYGFWRYPFHFIDLSAQNAINQYHFITGIVSEFLIMSCFVHEKNKNKTMLQIKRL